MSCGWDPLECAGDVRDKVTGAIAESAMDAIVAPLVEAANWSVSKIMTLWLKAPPPSITGADSPVAWVQEHLSYLVAAAMVGTLIYSGIRLALYARANEAINAAETFVRMVMTTAIAGVLITAGVELSEEWSQWILNRAELDLSVEFLSAATIPQGVVLVLALVVILTQLIQMAFMAVRNAVIVLLAGTITLAAATSGFQSGREAFNKHVAWLIAFILYKPLAALIYALSFTMASGDGLWEQLSGIFLMVLAVIALPALQRLVAPVTATLGGGNAGQLAGATVGAGIAMGAMALTGGASAAATTGGGGGFLNGGGSANSAVGGSDGDGPGGAKTDGLSPSSGGGEGTSAPAEGVTPPADSPAADLANSAGVPEGPSGAQSSGAGGSSPTSGGATSPSTPTGAAPQGAGNAAPAGGGVVSGPVTSPAPPAPGVGAVTQTVRGGIASVQQAASESAGDSGPIGSGRADA